MKRMTVSAVVIGALVAVVNGQAARSATVIAPKGWQADALTKGASILPADELVKLIDGIDGAAALVAVKETEDAKEKITRSKRFADFEAK